MTPKYEKTLALVLLLVSLSGCSYTVEKNILTSNNKLTDSQIKEIMDVVERTFKKESSLGDKLLKIDYEETQSDKEIARLIQNNSEKYTTIWIVWPLPQVLKQGGTTTLLFLISYTLTSCGY